MKANRLHITTLREKEITRFWDKIIPVGECWDWTGHVSKSGYGMLMLRGKVVQAHRIAYFLAKKKDPFPFFVLHTCDNRKCCRPSHIFLGTNKENILDAAKKGRMRHKLNPESVKAIRALLQEGISQATIAPKFGISQSIISDIHIGKLWTHIS